MNKIEYIRKNDLPQCLLEDENIFVAKLEGKDLSTKEQFFSSLQEVFQLPDVNNWDAISDWLTDLDWLDCKGYCLVIEDFSYLLCDDLKTKQIFIDVLLDEVLPWWEGDVAKYSVGGREKEFMVYLIDES